MSFMSSASCGLLRTIVLVVFFFSHVVNCVGPIAAAAANDEYKATASAAAAAAAPNDNAVVIEPIGKCPIVTLGKCLCFEQWDEPIPNPIAPNTPPQYQLGGSGRGGGSGGGSLAAVAIAAATAAAGGGGGGPSGGPPRAPKGLQVECTETTSHYLHNDLKGIAELGHRIFSLQVRDSNLRDMTNLPIDLNEVRSLSLGNTGIDLETIRESNENLLHLRSLRLYNEEFKEVPEDFFMGFTNLRVLELNNVGIAAISDDAFEFLEDTLEELQLRENRLRQIPIAIGALHYLQILDLTGNLIAFVPDDISRNLESSLKALRVARMDKMNCTCDFGNLEFVSWIRSHAIKGVTCAAPARLRGKDISTTPTEDFCLPSSSAPRLPRPLLIGYHLVGIVLTTVFASHFMRKFY